MDGNAPSPQIQAATARPVLAFEPMAMPAMDYKTYAELTHNIHLLAGVANFSNHVIVFTGAGGKNIAATERDHYGILEAAGLKNTKAVLNTWFPYKSEKTPIVYVAVVPREELHTCMRYADIKEYSDLVSLRSAIGRAVHDRADDLAEARQSLTR